LGRLRRHNHPKEGNLGEASLPKPLQRVSPTQ
jgi:hypothetical protein